MDQEKLTESLAVMREQLRWITQELAELKHEVKNLNAFKWKMIGAAIVAGAIFSAWFEIARAMN